MLNTRAAMIIEIVTTDSRAPSVKEQKAENRADGTEPERTFEFPAWEGHHEAIVYEKDEDVIVVTTPRVLGTATKAMPFLVRMGRTGAKLKLPNQPPISVETPEQQQDVLDLIAKASWRKGLAKGRRGRGRPPKRSQPNAEVMKRGLKMWQRPRTADDPDGFTRGQCIDYHQDELNRKVAEWELKHWYGDKRSPEKEPDT